MLPSDSPDVIARFHAELDLVMVVARSLYRRLSAAVEFDELMSAGREGLLDAARRFDAECGAPFRGYARIRVEGAMWDYARQNSGLPRRTRDEVAAERAALSARESALTARPRIADTPSPSPTESSVVSDLATAMTATALALERAALADASALEGESPEQALERKELRAALNDYVDDLGPHETALIRRHYFAEEHLEDIAADLGMSRASASRRHAKALSRLKKLLRSER